MSLKAKRAAKFFKILHELVDSSSVEKGIKNNDTYFLDLSKKLRLNTQIENIDQVIDELHDIGRIFSSKSEKFHNELLATINILRAIEKTT